MTRSYAIVASILLLLFSTSCRRSKTVIEIVEDVKPSVVSILSYNVNGELLSQGSGFIVSKNGEVITNRHVLRGAFFAEVKMVDEKKYNVKGILAEDMNSDLVKVLLDAPYVTFDYLSDYSSKIAEGENIVVVGTPLGLQGTISEGIVSAVRTTGNEVKLIQITAPISPGSSGSPVVNLKGDVIGVATLQLTEGQNLNFAVPAEKMLSLKSKDFISITEWGLYDQAIQVANTIIDDFEKADALVEVRITLEETDQIEKVHNIESQLYEIFKNTRQIDKIHSEWTSIYSFDTNTKKYELLKKIVVKHSKPENVIYLVKSISNEKEKVFFITDIAQGYIEDGKNKEAEILLKSAESISTKIDSLENRIFALYNIAYCYLQNNQKKKHDDLLTEVLRIAKILNKFEYHKAVQFLLEEQITKATQALDTFYLISQKDPEITNIIKFLNATSYQYMINQKHKAEELLSKSHSLLNYINDNLQKAELSLDLAHTYLAFGDSIRSEEIAKEALNALRQTNKTSDIKQKVGIMLRLAHRYLTFGDSIRSEEIAKEALNALRQTNKTNDIEQKIDIMIDISAIYTKLNKKDKSKEILDNVLKFLKRLNRLNVESDFFLIMRYRNVASGYIEAHSYDDALKIVAEITNILEEYNRGDRIIFAEFLSQIVIDLINANQIDKALSVIQLMRVSSGGESRPLAELVKYYIKLGEIERAFEYAEMIRDAFYKAQSMSNIAEVFITSKEYEKAFDALNKSIIMTESIKDLKNKSIMFSKIAVLYSKIRRAKT